MEPTSSPNLTSIPIPESITSPTIELGPYLAIDQQLVDISKEIDFFGRLGTQNTGEEKARFFASGFKTEPKFKYDALDFDPEEVCSRLNTIEIPKHDPALHELYQAQVTGLINLVTILEYRGTREQVLPAALEIWGRPDERVLKEARAILQGEQTARSNSDSKVSSQEVAAALHAKLKEYGLSEWEIHFREAEVTAVSEATKRIYLCENRLFESSDAARLAVHEVEVHILRSANGRSQPLSILGIGITGYDATEEGLAAYAEQITGHSDAELLKTYAGRAIAVDSMASGHSFSATFKLLTDMNFSPDKAWEIAQRGHACGGSTKDHIYFSGLIMIRSFVECGGDIKELYAGKFGLHHLDLIRSLTEKGVLHAARMVPEFLN